MAQHNWAYTGGSGRQYVVGLYHGTESGHLMVYCNLSVIYIDFSVLQNWKYSFFIEDDLLELKIERKDNGFHYGFDVNRQADTPKNRERKAREKTEKRTMSLFFAIIGVVGMLFLGAWWYNEIRVGSKELEAVKYSGWQVPTKVFFEPGDKDIRYSFAVHGKVIEGSAPMPENTILPLESGDEFMVNYDYGRPRVHAIDFKDPSPLQEQRYRQRALERHLQLHPDLDKNFVECLLKLAFEQKDLAAYADFYYQNASPEENEAHNRNTYGRLVRDIPFQKMVKEECK